MLEQKIRIDPEKASFAIQEFVREKVGELKREGIIIGLSGGLDSSVVAALSARALGERQVLGVFMPEKHSSQTSKHHAQLISDQLGICFKIEKITSKLNRFRDYRFVPGKSSASILRRVVKPMVIKTKEKSSFATSLSEPKNRILAKANAIYRLKHRMRMLNLYYYAEDKNYLVVGAANKTEFAIGFFVSYGCDNAADIMPIRHLFKTQMKQLAEYLEIPKKIINKSPSPDWIPGMTDEAEIGMPYKTLDLILFGLEQGLTSQQICNELECQPGEVDYVLLLMEKSRYRRELPYIMPV